MTDSIQASEALDIASQKHEKEIVIEFGPDRILHYIGVYLVGFLAVLTKISELAAASLSCHPAGNTSTDGEFISYARTYCWESSTVVSSELNSTDLCGNATSQFESNLLKDPATFKAVIRILPYAMIIEALLYALPSVWWHYRVGAKLMGHMKFMRLLLNDIYESVKPIKMGIYRSKSSYDSQSYYLNGWTGYKPNYRSGKMDLQEDKDQSKCSRILRRKRNRDIEASEKKDETQMGALIDVASSSSNHAVQASKASEDSADAEKDSGCFTKLLFGDMRDRHLFSMLCFENFSSLEHHPYILSVYKLSGTPEEPSDKGFTGSKTKGILRLLCNKRNFSGRFLVKSYFYKHMIGTVVSIFIFCLTGVVLYLIGTDGWNSESFRCDIIYHPDLCMICTIRRKLDVIAYLFVNLAVNILYFIVSIMQLVFVRRSSDRAICHYFEEISDTGSAALRRA